MPGRITLTVLAVLIAVSSLNAQSSTIRTRAMTPYRLGFENMRAEAYDKAAKDFQAAIDIDPTFEWAHYMLGRALLAQKKYREALQAFTKTRDMYAVDAGRRFSNSQEAQRQRDTEMRELDQAISEYQRGPQTQQTQNATRQLQNRRRYLQDVMDRGRNMTLELSVPSYVSLSLGSTYFRMGNIAEAEKAYKEAVASDPSSGEAYSNLAVVYMETGRFAEAEKSVEAAEKAGFKVHPQLKADIAARLKGGS